MIKMKCLRCGTEVKEGTKYCDKCGFDVEKQKEYQIIYKEVDPELENGKKTNLIDFPVLTFIFGILSMINAILLMSTRPIAVIFIISFFIIFVSCFIFSTKKAKVKLRPFRDVGIIIAFVALALVLIFLFQNIFI